MLRDKAFKGNMNDVLDKFCVTDVTTATNEADNNQSSTDLVTNDNHNDDRRDNVDKIDLVELNQQ